MKTKRPLKKTKKVSEKEKLQKLLEQMTLSVKHDEERLARCQELDERSSTKGDDKKSQKNKRRLDEARRSLEESLIFMSQLTEALERQ